MTAPEPDPPAVGDASERSAAGLAGVLAFVVALGFVVYQFIVQIAYSPLRGAIERELSLSVLESGLVAASFLGVYALMQIPAGLLLDRFGSRVLLTGAVLGTGAGGWLFSQSDSLEGLVASRALIGVAAAFAFPGTGKVARTALPAGGFAVAMGVAEAAIGLGGALGHSTAQALEVSLGWRDTMAWFARWALPLAVLCAITLRGATPAHPPRTNAQAQAQAQAQAETGRESLAAAFAAVMRHPTVWRCAAIYAGAIGVLFGLGSFWNTPLSLAWEWDARAAGQINAALFIGFGLGSPVFGWLGPRWGEVRTLRWTYGAAMAALILWVLVPIDLGLPFDLANAGLLGFALGGSVLAFTLACNAMPARHTAAAIGLVNFSGVACGALLKLLPGVLVPAAAGGALAQQQAACAVFIVVLSLSVLATMSRSPRP